MAQWYKRMLFYSERKQIFQYFSYTKNYANKLSFIREICLGDGQYSKFFKISYHTQNI